MESPIENFEIPQVVSLCYDINDRFSERIPPWEHFPYRTSAEFSIFFRKIMHILLSDIAPQDEIILMIFLKNCLSSLHMGFVLDSVQKIVFVRTWVVLTEERRETELARNSRWAKAWRAFDRKYQKMTDTEKSLEDFYATFLHSLMEKFLSSKDHKLKLSLHFVDLLITIESTYYCKRFVHVLLENSHVLLRLKRLESLGQLFLQMVSVLESYLYAEIDLTTGDELTKAQVVERHYQRMTQLQRLLFQLEPEKLKSFTLVSVGSVDSPERIRAALGCLGDDQLERVVAHFKLADRHYERDFMEDIIVAHFARRPLQVDQLNSLPLYPTEREIWAESMAGGSPEREVTLDCFALPKLNLQFLSLFDYYTRNFNLFRMESTFEIRQELENAIRRLKPHAIGGDQVVFDGWARMAQPIVNFRITQVGKPKLGQLHPSCVVGELTLHLNLPREVKREWESLQRYDVGFLVTVRPGKGDFDPSWITAVRGCEVRSVLDDEGNELDYNQLRPAFLEEERVYRVCLDPNQYQLDMRRQVHIDIYQSFNLFMRRKPEVNNFKAVLETIRGLLNSKPMIPEWLGEAFLGYGDPSVACYKNLDSRIWSLNWADTFLDEPHLRASFPDCDISFVDSSHDPPYSLTFSSDNQITAKSQTRPYSVAPFLPRTKRNSVRFTPTQVEAIHSGMQPGLTLISGPPGTGKTDLAAQIISNLYHNFPNERTLIVTHSNQALNQLFEKLISLDIEERHLLRLGHGEEDLDTDKNFSRYGRVDYVLATRLEMLDEVGRLQKSLGISSWVEHNCESARHLFTYEIEPRWIRFWGALERAERNVEMVGELFPFSVFFAESTPDGLFGGEDWEEDCDIARQCYSYIESLFGRLKQFHPFELLRNRRDRVNYLLVKEARIIAMTCTHAALKRGDLIATDFRFDNVLMEEAGRVLEIETFIPLLLQDVNEENSLRRWIMLGDDRQLPPIVKNRVLQKYCNMEQSLFGRFIRFGVPVIELDMQGRSRPSICELYGWRYPKLGSLPHVLDHPDFARANAGLVHEFQFINVDSLNGVGETEPTQHFYQNLGEAEYVVALFMYMRLVGYPGESITILSTYNGQVQLIRDIVRVRCASNSVFGAPAKICTVDKYQGRQNDYVLLSLVRTKHVGHLRDVRRLIVALSRARLGLYVFGKMSLFYGCPDVRPVFDLFGRRPTKLMLMHDEVFPVERPVGTSGPFTVVEGVEDMTFHVERMYKHMLEVYMDWKRAQDEKIREEMERRAELERAEREAQEEMERLRAMRTDSDLIVNEVEAD